MGRPTSVRDTLAHILGAEWIYLERWQGRSPEALLDPATFPTVQSLESKWEKLELDQMQFIEALTRERLLEELALDSLDLVAVILQLQDRFEVEIDPDEIPHMRTVADLGSSLTSHLRRVA